MQAFNPNQLGLWDPAPQRGLRPLPMPNADVRYDPDFLPTRAAKSLFDALLTGQPWKQSKRVMFERRVSIPRLQVWYGPEAIGLDEPELHPLARPWPPILLDLKPLIEQAAGVTFDAVLLNLYRDGQDSVAWHADRELTTGPQPVIASLTLGAERRFMFRPRPGCPGHPLGFVLPSGSLLVMGLGTQEHWEHQVPKTTRPVGPRINLTFRVIPPAGRR